MIDSRELTFELFSSREVGLMEGRAAEKFSDKKKWDREQEQKPTESQRREKPTESLHRWIDQKEALSAHKNLFQRDAF